MKLVSIPCRVCAVAALALAAFGGNTLAADSADATTVRPPLLLASADSAATSDLQVGIDPATGMLRPPTASERLELAALAREATSGLRRAVAATEFRHADGSVSAAVDASLYSATTVVVDAEGHVHYACADAGHFHPTTTVTAPAAEDR